MSIIECRNVTYSYSNKYRDVPVLRGVDCSFERGKFYAIVGKSGSGKSTLLSLMAGLDLPKGGDIIFEGKSTRNIPLSAYRRNNVAVVYQQFCLFPLMTAVENVMYPMEMKHVKKSEAKKRAEELILHVGLDKELFRRYPAMMSGGEQQRVAIARALAMGTGVILADEPTGNLDGASSDTIIDILRRLALEENYCVIIVTHDVGVLDRVNAVYRIVEGRLKEDSAEQ